MRLLKQAMAVLGTVVMIAVLVALVAPKSVHAVVATLVQIVPSGTTQVGQSESEIVSLTCITKGSYCVSVDPTGTPSTSSYAVPTGYTLIITDYEYVFFTNSGFAGLNICDDLFIIQEGLASPLPVLTGCALADKNGTVVGQFLFPAGVRVGSGSEIEDLGTYGYSGYSTFAHGYLVPN